jgi:hypothetical protein
MRSAVVMASSWSWVTKMVVRPSRALHVQQFLAHLHAQRLVQVGQRLVQQQHLRLDDHGARQRHALLLAARQLVGPALRVVGQAHHVERRAHLLADLVPVSLRSTRPKATLSHTVRCGHSA